MPHQLYYYGNFYITIVLYIHSICKNNVQVLKLFHRHVQNDFKNFITLVKNRQCTLYKYDLTFVNGLPSETQLTTVKSLYFSILVSNF